MPFNGSTIIHLLREQTATIRLLLKAVQSSLPGIKSKLVYELPLGKVEESVLTHCYCFDTVGNLIWGSFT